MQDPPEQSFTARYFGTEEKRIGAIGAVLSGLGFLLSIISLFFVNLAPKDAIPWFILIRDILLVSGLILLLLYMIYRYAKREAAIPGEVQPYVDQAVKYQGDIQRLARESQSLHEQIRLLCDLSRKYKSALFHNYFSPDLQRRPYVLTHRDRILFDSMCFFITSDVRRLLIQHFLTKGVDPQDDVAISVKLIVPKAFLSERFDYEDRRVDHDDDELVVTVFRDPATHNKGDREVKKVLYDIKGNTAFRELMEEGIESFINNNLKGMNNYHNRTKEWGQFYNAACVVPIKHVDTHGRIRKYYGFLAADSLNTEGGAGQIKYDEDCKLILSHGADALATFFLLLALLDGVRPRQPRDE